MYINHYQPERKLPKSYVMNISLFYKKNGYFYEFTHFQCLSGSFLERTVLR